MARWIIECEPKGKNDGVNEGGMVVFVVSGGTRQEVSAVGFVRRNTKNPNRNFADQLKLEVDKARTATGLLNEQLQSAGELQ